MNPHMPEMTFVKTDSQQSVRGEILTLRGTQLVLCSERCVWWEERSVVFICDTHFGKEAAFRAAAIPVPDQTQAILERLSRVLTVTGAKHLVILGDLLHSRAGRCRQTFGMIAEWRRKHAAVELTLVRGNHDETSGDPPDDWGIRCHAEPLDIWSPIRLSHRPLRSSQHAVLAGHLHPVIRLSGPGRDTLRLPCFHLRDEVLVLPSFSSFVDGAAIRPQPGDQNFAICEDRVIRIPAPGVRGIRRAARPVH